MEPRKTTVSVSYNGRNIDDRLAGFLSSFSYSDIASGESDQLSLVINDRERKWIREWFPKKGDSIQASIVLDNWERSGETRTLNCGSFGVDDFSFSGSPIELELGAVALPAASGFKETKRSRTYEKTTLENIGKEVAGRAGIALYYEAPEIPIEKTEQSEEDDCTFYNKIVKLYGFAMKIYMNKIVVFSEATYEKRDPVATLTESDIVPGWRWNSTLVRTYTGARYEYTNHDKNKTFLVNAGSGSRILKITDPAGSLEEARRITLAKLNDANKNDTTMSVTIAGTERKIVATDCVRISGLGNLDGKYYVEKVNWSIGKGCCQDLELRKVYQRIINAKAKAVSAAEKSEVETKTSIELPVVSEQDGETEAPKVVKGGRYTLTVTKKGYYTAAEALAGKAEGGHPTGTRRPGTYIIFNISQGMLNLTTKESVPGSWINPD